MSNNNNEEEVLMEISSCGDNNNENIEQCHSAIDIDDDNDEDEDDEELQEETTEFHDEEVTAQLFVSGPVGVAAAAAIVSSSKNRKKPYNFETNPSIRKRQSNRLLRKLKYTIDEYSTRVGQQAVVLVVTPGKQTNFKVFGAKPLENIIKDLREVITTDLDNALVNQTPPQAPNDPTLFELPPLIIDGIPTPVEKMTQAQLRAFIPLMLRYSTGRGKPGWGRESTRPPWWPKDLPWSNVRMDARSESDKRQRSWTAALREVVINCYKYHGREDLLPNFNPLLKVTIKNPDGTISTHQIDPKNPFITLADGTKASIQGLDGININEIDEININNEQPENITIINENNLIKPKIEQQNEQSSKIIQINSVAQATINSEGQIILTDEEGHNFPIPTNGIITLPSVYQTLIDGSNNGDENSLNKIQTINANDLNQQSIVLQTGDGEGQLYRVITLENALSNGFEFANIKSEEIESNK